MRPLAFLAKGPDLLRSAIQSWLWRRLLHAPGLSLASGSQIIGDRSMRIGRDFRAGRLLWLEAVSQYGLQRLEPRLLIGDRVSCSDGVHIACAFTVAIGQDVLIGSKVHVTDHNHGRYSGPMPHSSPNEAPAQRALAGAPVVIGDRVFLADGVIVLPGSVIGAGTIVGANSVVYGPLPANAICVGNPARPIRRFSDADGIWQPVIPTGAATTDIPAEQCPP